LGRSYFRLSFSSDLLAHTLLYDVSFYDDKAKRAADPGVPRWRWKLYIMQWTVLFFERAIRVQQLARIFSFHRDIPRSRTKQNAFLFVLRLGSCYRISSKCPLLGAAGRPPSLWLVLRPSWEKCHLRLCDSRRRHGWTDCCFAIGRRQIAFYCGGGSRDLL
jgi:hypothetical protein